MKTVITLLSVLFLFSSCSKDSPETDTLGEFNTKTLMHDGEERSYHVYLPNNFDKTTPTPIVLALHGGSGTGKMFERDVSGGTLTAAAEQRGMIIITPEGIDNRWNDGRPEIFNGGPSYNDVGFISSIIDAMITNYGIDQNKVYATGISNGGFMSFRLALELSDRLAAVAPVTAQITEAVESMVPEFPIAIMLVNGLEDPLVPYDGGCIDLPRLPECSRGIILSTQETIDKFLGFNQCTNPAETELVIDAISDDGTSVEITRYTACEQGTEVVLVKVVGGGHTWPRGSQYLSEGVIGKVSQEINASELILDFFLEHTLN